MECGQEFPDFRRQAKVALRGVIAVECALVQPVRNPRERSLSPVMSCGWRRSGSVSFRFARRGNRRYQPVAGVGRPAHDFRNYEEAGRVVRAARALQGFSPWRLQCNPAGTVHTRIGALMLNRFLAPSRHNPWYAADCAGVPNSISPRSDTGAWRLRRPSLAQPARVF